MEIVIYLERRNVEIVMFLKRHNVETSDFLKILVAREIELQELNTGIQKLHLKYDRQTYRQMYGRTDKQRNL